MRLCLVRPGVSMQDYQRDAKHRRHQHIAREDAEVLVRRGFAQYLDQKRTVLQLVPAGRFPLHGSSQRYGECLAAAIRSGEPWALLARDDMRKRKGGRW